MTVSDLLEQPCYKSDNTQQACYKLFKQLVQNCHIMTVSDLLEQPCYKSDNINKLVTSCLNNLYNIVISWLFRTCWNNLATNLIISTSLLQLLTTYIQYCYIMTVSDLLEQPCYKSDNINKLVTSCLNNLYNIVISWLYRTCWNNHAKSLIISTRLLQAVQTTCDKLDDNLGQAVRTQRLDSLLAHLLQNVRFLRV